MLEKYVKAISEVAIRVLAPLAEDNAQVLYSKIEERVVHDMLHLMANNGSEELTDRSMAAIITQVLIERLTMADLDIESR